VALMIGGTAQPPKFITTVMITIAKLAPVGRRQVLCRPAGFEL
jgi:hypothetical protein